MSDQLSEHGDGKLKKSHVGLFALVGMYYAEICSGAFGIEEMIPEAGPGMTMLLLVLLAVIWALCARSWDQPGRTRAAFLFGSRRPWVNSGMASRWSA